MIENSASDVGDEVLVDSDRAFVEAVKFLRALGIDHPLGGNQDMPYSAATDYSDRAPGHAMDSHIAAWRKAIAELEQSGIRLPALTEDIANAFALMTLDDYFDVCEHLDQYPDRAWSREGRLDDEQKLEVENVLRMHRARNTVHLQLSAAATDPVLKSAYERQEAAAFFHRTTSKPRASLHDRLEAQRILEQSGIRKRR
ncbi:MAG: hypothetical protein U0836_17945 [Pirellulales bacterium]